MHKNYYGKFWKSRKDLKSGKILFPSWFQYETEKKYLNKLNQTKLGMSYEARVRHLNDQYNW